MKTFSISVAFSSKFIPADLYPPWSPAKTSFVDKVANQLIEAIKLAQTGQWEAAHELAQQHEGNALADWIHAVLHKIEGDAGNSRYWYARAGRLEHVATSPEAEWPLIRQALEP